MFYFQSIVIRSESPPHPRDKMQSNPQWQLSDPFSEWIPDHFENTKGRSATMTGDLAILDKSNLENLTLGPFTINSEQYARQLVNLSEHLS